MFMSCSLSHFLFLSFSNCSHFLASFSLLCLLFFSLFFLLLFSLFSLSLSLTLLFFSPSLPLSLPLSLSLLAVPGSHASGCRDIAALYRVGWEACLGGGRSRPLAFCPNILHLKRRDNQFGTYIGQDTKRDNKGWWLLMGWMRGMAVAVTLVVCLWAPCIW